MSLITNLLSFILSVNCVINRIVLILAIYTERTLLLRDPKFADIEIILLQP